MQLFLHGLDARRLAFLEQPGQHRLHPALRLPRRQVQNPQVLLDRSLRTLLEQQVVGQTKLARREQVRTVAVILEGPRLAYQPVDHVAVLDPMLATTTQTRQLLHTPLCVPHLDLLGADPRLYPLADQAARYRVDVALDVNRAALVHTHRPPFARFQTPRRQRPQQR